MAINTNQSSSQKRLRDVSVGRDRPRDQKRAVMETTVVIVMTTRKARRAGPLSAATYSGGNSGGVDDILGDQLVGPIVVRGSHKDEGPEGVEANGNLGQNAHYLSNSKARKKAM
jgi:hypothetical protein